MNITTDVSHVAKRGRGENRFESQLYYLQAKGVGISLGLIATATSDVVNNL